MKGSKRDPLKGVRLLLLDMDGVVTQERRYWDCAALTAYEIFEAGRFCDGPKRFDPSLPLSRYRNVIRSYLPDPVIVAFKERAINSNWDLCHLITSIYMIPILEEAKALAPRVLERILEVGIHSVNLKSLAHWVPLPKRFAEKRKALVRQFLRETGRLQGFDVVKHLNEFIGKKLGMEVNVFYFGDPLWTKCQKIFQEWYRGSEPHGKRGLIHEEVPLVPPKKLVRLFESLTRRGLTLGMATGRPYREIKVPLTEFGIWDYFHPRHLCTNREIDRAKINLGHNGIYDPIGKPHPFSFFRAIFPEKSDRELFDFKDRKLGRNEVAVVGDAVGDILGARAVGGVSICVLTGAGGKRGKKRLAKYKPDFIIDDVTKLEDLFVT